MKRIILFVILCLSFAFVSCTKDDLDKSSFSIYGEWGMLDGTIVDEDGKSTTYPAMGFGNYYEIDTFFTNGTYTQSSSSSTKAGVFSYNESTKELKMKENGYTYYAPSYITVISSSEMTQFIDYGKIGSITKHFKKLQ